MRAPTYSTDAGTLARSDSTTALRPATNSAASPAPRGVRPGASPDPRGVRPGASPDPRGVRPGASSGRRVRVRSLLAGDGEDRAGEADATALRRWAGWPGRMAAGGVGPLPSSARRP